MAAIVGAAGLPPCLAAARAGKRLLLANKEALVVGGALFMRAVQRGRRHAAADRQRAFGDLPVPAARTAAHVAASASTTSCSPPRAGRFAAATRRRCASVTPDEACAHPNWVMGRKISVDSATMMNKALEVIEARWLFDLAPEQIRVVIHPQSIIHSMVVCRDGSVLAQLGTPDMRGADRLRPVVPGAHRVRRGAARLRDAGGADLRGRRRAALPRACTWPGTRCAAPEGSTTVLNAANEVAVAAFLDRQHRASTAIHRDQRARPSRRCCRSWATRRSLDDLLALDERARAHARQLRAGAGAMITTVLAFLVTLAVLIVVHEYGHYRVAVACGVKVLRFSVGFGRVLWRRQRGARQHRVRGLARCRWAATCACSTSARAPVPADELHRAFNRQPLCAARGHRRRRAGSPTCCWRCCCSPRRTGSASTSRRRVLGAPAAGQPGRAGRAALGRLGARRSRATAANGATCAR